MKIRFKSSRRLLAEGVCNYHLGNYETALQSLRACERRKYRLPDVAEYTGFCFLAQGLYREAIPFLERAKQAGLKNPILMSQLAHAYRLANHFATAEKILLEALAQDWDNADYHCQLGDVLFDEGFTKIAQEQYEWALLLDPAHTLALLGLGSCFFTHLDYKNAIRTYRAAIRLEPENLIALENLERLYEHIRQYGRQRQTQRRIALLTGTSAEYYKTRPDERRTIPIAIQ